MKQLIILKLAEKKILPQKKVNLESYLHTNIMQMYHKDS